MIEREDQYARWADLCRMLANPLRLRILDELRHGETCVYHLWQMTGRSQPVISQHLRRLRDGGLVVTRRRGARIFYNLASHRELHQLLDLLLGPVSERRFIPRQACEECLPDRNFTHSTARGGA